MTDRVSLFACVRRLSRKESRRLLRTPGASAHPICGIVVGSSWHAPVACAYPPDHRGAHSWATIPQFESDAVERSRKQ
jgi:hypothetical protein